VEQLIYRVLVLSYAEGTSCGGVASEQDTYGFFHAAADVQDEQSVAGNEDTESALASPRCGREGRGAACRIPHDSPGVAAQSR
jgi:hypothetical protein